MRNNCAFTVTLAAFAAVVAAVAFAGPAVGAADWPQYRGPTHDGATEPKFDIAARWPKGQPKVLWKKEVGNAFGSFAVAGGKASVPGAGRQRGRRRVEPGHR